MILIGIILWIVIAFVLDMVCIYFVHRMHACEYFMCVCLCVLQYKRMALPSAAS